METILATLGLKPSNRGATTGGSQDWLTTRGETLASVSPIDGQPIAHIQQATADDYDAVVATAREAFENWRCTPAPQRGLLRRTNVGGRPEPLPHRSGRNICADSVCHGIRALGRCLPDAQ